MFSPSRQAAALGVAVLIGTLAMCAPPRASQAAYALSGDEAVSIICAPQYSWSCEQALAVAWRESNWQPHAYNAGCGCAGLFQIASVHGHPLSTLFDPEMNVAIAYELYLQRGWQPWGQ